MNTWQLCPKCNGLGQSSGVGQCDLCNGTKVISIFTGRPPASITSVSTLNSSSTTANGSLVNLPKND